MNEMKFRLALEELGINWETSDTVVGLVYDLLRPISQETADRANAERERVWELATKAEQRLGDIDWAIDKVFELAEERDNEDELRVLGDIDRAILRTITDLKDITYEFGDEIR